MTALMTASEAASVATSDLAERFTDEGRAALVELVMDTRALAARRIAARKLLDSTEAEMKTRIRALDAAGVAPGSIDRLTDYSPAQRRLAVRGLSRHPGGPQPSTGRRAGRPRKATS